jgi:subtilisin family serine protease
VRLDDPRLKGAKIEGWNIRFGATGHALLGADFHDEAGHGTEVAAAVHQMAPDAELLAVKIMDSRLRTSADLMAAGLETASRHGAQVINLSLGTPNMGKALLLRDCCALAVDNGSLVIAAAHPKGGRAYPADLPETVGVASHPDCPHDKFFYFAPDKFPRAKFGALTEKFLTYGYAVPKAGGKKNIWRGSGIATAYMSGRVACICEALPDADTPSLLAALMETALVPAAGASFE